MEPNDAARRSAYTGDRPDLVAALPALDHGDLVVDVGCSTGVFGAEMQRLLGVDVIGIESDPDSAREASVRLFRVVQADAVGALEALSVEEVHPRLVVFGDVLEHLVDPEGTLDRARELMPSGGWILVSLPNVGHYDTLWNLIRGRWPVRSRGIHDSSHLHFFAYKNVLELLNTPATEIELLRRTFRLLERPSRVNRYSKLVAWIWPNLFTFQFVIRARVNGALP